MSSHNLKLTSLTALVVGSMIGGGIFSLPQNMAESASAGATLIGWGITAVGMLMLALVFQTLANRKPDLDNGIYAYAKAGFGPYIGFSSAWGYWLSAFLGNVSYYVLIFSTLGYFFPIFGKGNTVAAIIAASVFLWALQLMILKGIKNATFINQLITVAKIVPLITFIVIMFTAFKADLFTADFWGKGNIELGSVMSQVKNMMLVTVWVFIGIEGASIYSARAEKRSDVGKATVLGFLMVLALLVLVNILSLGVLSQPELAGMSNPSMAYVLEHVVGKWGAVFISVGLIISVAGALLAWTLFCAEILFSAAQDDSMPNFLKKENKNAVPSNALWMSSLATQLFLIVAFFSEGTYTSLFYLATSMILLPYFFSTAYALKLAITGESYENAAGAKGKDFIIGIIAVIYSIWLVYAAGIQYLLLSALLYLPGTILYVMARTENKQPIFNAVEKIIFAVLVIGAGIAGYGLYAGFLSL